MPNGDRDTALRSDGRRIDSGHQNCAASAKTTTRSAWVPLPPHRPVPKAELAPRTHYDNGNEATNPLFNRMAGGARKCRLFSRIAARMPTVIA